MRWESGGCRGFSFICIPPGSAVVYRVIVYVIMYMLAGVANGQEGWDLLTEVKFGNAAPGLSPTRRPLIGWHFASAGLVGELFIPFVGQVRDLARIVERVQSAESVLDDVHLEISVERACHIDVPMGKLTNTRPGWFHLCHHVPDPSLHYTVLTPTSSTTLASSPTDW